MAQQIETQNPLRLALDIGTNSIGWALYGLDKNKKPKNIVGAGVRIFSSGRTPKTHTTLNATRRKARLQRRQRDRYLQRRTYLLHLLEKYGLFPADRFSAKALAELNPYKIRTKGLYEKLDIHHFGRALFHLNQRRGFKSNRRSDAEKEDGLIAQSVKASKEAIQKSDSRTYGEFLYKRLQKMEENRSCKTPKSHQENWILARKTVGAGAKDNYAVYANRSMLEDEFNQLWDSQARFHKILKDQKIKEILFKKLFYQRPLKKPVVGTCEFTGEDRIHKALPSFQRFRILKELNNLAYINNLGVLCLINSMGRGIKFRDKMIRDLFLKKSKVKFSVLEKEFRKFFSNIDDFKSFNLHTENRDYLEGDKTSVVLRKVVPEWDNWSLEVQDLFVETLEGKSSKKEDLYMKTDEEVLEDLKKLNQKKQLKLSKDQLKDCLNSINKLPKDYGRYSKTAINKILPFLKEGKQEFESIPLAGYGHHSDRGYKDELLEKLPLYQDVLSSHCVEMRKVKNNVSNVKKLSKKEKYKNFRIPNPTVHIAFNQLRLVVNDIIKNYGKPAQVVIETARDLPKGATSKKEIEKKIKENQKRNEEAKKSIEEFGLKVTKDSRIKYLLWKEQKQKCIYSGKQISKTKLNSGELEVDHILPFSKTLDNGLSNKVLVYKSANQNKGSQTPFECFSYHKEEWEGILQRVKDLPKNKQWRFYENAMNKFEEEGGWLARQLNDTRYISRYAKQYLERICSDIWTVRGQTTALLRYNKKNRNDHRHHAQDALTIGLVDRSRIQNISNTVKQHEITNKSVLENIRKIIKEEVLPWSNFEKDAQHAIDKIIVSHRRRTKKEGQLHNDTAYGFSSKVKDFSQLIEVFHYLPIETLEKYDKKQLEKKVVSSKIKQDFLDEIKKKGSLSKDFLKTYHQKTSIRRVRIKEKETVIPIKNKAGKVYKCFNGDSNYAVNLFINSNNKWDAEIVDTFTANQKNFNSIPKDSKLMKGDMLFFNKKFWKLVKFDKRKRFIFTEHYASGSLKDLNQYPDTKLQVSQKIPSSLQVVNPKRVWISPCGKVKLTDFKLRKLKKEEKLKKV